MEIQVNDWAMAEMIKEKPLLIPVFGILLNKRRKDPRLHYKLETMTQTGAEAGGKFLEENSLNADFYREYLEERMRHCQVSSGKAVGYDMALPTRKEQPASFLFIRPIPPSTARCMQSVPQESGESRSWQSSVREFCKDYAFLYPDHLKMVGRYNSLFATGQPHF